METTFLVWSAAAGSQGTRNGAVYLPNPLAAPLLPAAGAAMEPPREGFRPPPPPPRHAKAKKKPSGPKKPPQRGLGVEQLERLRLQEQWKNVTDAHHPTAASHHPGTHHHHHHQDQLLHAFEGRSLPAVPRGSSLARFSSSPAPAGGWGETTSLQRHGPAALPVVDSVVPYNSAALDRYRVAMVEASLQVGNGAFTEFPSSQSLHCSEQCDVCRRKKRMWEEEEGNGEDGEGKSTLDLLGDGRRRTAASTERMADAWREVTETEVKEFMFFPGGGGSSSHSGSWAMEGRRMTAGDYRSSCARSGTQLDLSLKLSF